MINLLLCPEYLRTIGPTGGGVDWRERWIRCDGVVWYNISRAPCRDEGLPQLWNEGMSMGFDQYHEPPDELPAETRTFARMIASLTEEAEAIGWYEQRLAVEPDAEARAIMADAQAEEFKHFGMDLEFLLRRTPKWRAALEAILFREGSIVEHGEEGEKAEEHT